MLDTDFIKFILNVNLYQVVIFALSAMMLIKGVQDYFSQRMGQTFLKLAVRVIVWGGMGLIAIYPNSTVHFARFIGVVDNINAAILTGFVLIFLIIFKLMSAIEKLEQNISELTRKDALRDLEANSSSPEDTNDRP